ncbi:MAG: trehalose-phosphatase [Methanocella sp.]
MDVLTPGLDLARYLSGIAHASERVLLLDYDGTLAPFRIRPQLAKPYPRVREALNAILHAGGTRVIITSGRRAADLPPLLPLRQRPEIWGLHGWERLQPDGTMLVAQQREEEREALEEAAAVLEPTLRAGSRIERKPGSVALHWRGVPAIIVAKLKAAAAATWKALALDRGLDFVPFDGGIELRAPGWNTLNAVRTLLDELPRNAAVAYLGDDTADEDVFEEVKARGIAVLVRERYRQTNADVWLRPPRDLLAFLRHWCVAPGAA